MSERFPGLRKNLALYKNGPLSIYVSLRSALDSFDRGTSSLTEDHLSVLKDLTENWFGLAHEVRDLLTVVGALPPATPSSCADSFNTGSPCPTCFRNRVPDWRGTIAYHYRCDKCGRDCTAGQPAGPCTQDAAGVRRCHECQGAWNGEQGALRPHTYEEADAIIEALSEIAHPLGGMGAGGVTDEQRRIAKAIVERHAGRRR